MSDEPAAQAHALVEQDLYTFWSCLEPLVGLRGLHGRVRERHAGGNSTRSAERVARIRRGGRDTAGRQIRESNSPNWRMVTVPQADNLMARSWNNATLRWL